MWSLFDYDAILHGHWWHLLHIAPISLRELVNKCRQRASDAAVSMRWFQGKCIASSFSVALLGGVRRIWIPISCLHLICQPIYLSVRVKLASIFEGGDQSCYVGAFQRPVSISSPLLFLVKPRDQPYRMIDLVSIKAQSHDRSFDGESDDVC